MELTRDEIDRKWNAQSAVRLVQDYDFPEEAAVMRIESVNYDILFEEGMDDSTSKRLLRYIEQREREVQQERIKMINKWFETKQQQKISARRKQQENELQSLKNKVKLQWSMKPFIAPEVIFPKPKRVACNKIFAAREASRLIQIQKNRASLASAIAQPQLHLDAQGIAQTVSLIRDTRQFCDKMNKCWRTSREKSIKEAAALREEEELLTLRDRCKKLSRSYLA